MPNRMGSKTLNSRMKKKKLGREGKKASSRDSTCPVSRVKNMDNGTLGGKDKKQEEERHSGEKHQKRAR